MNQFTSKELLYMEDMSKMFESISKTCDATANITTDTQFKTYLQNMSKDHKQWIADTASIINQNKLQ